MVEIIEWMQGYWWLVILIAGLSMTLLALYVEVKNDSFMDDFGHFITKEEVKESNAKAYKTIMEVPGITTVVIDIRKERITMRVPIEAIIKIDGYTLMMDPNFGDYTLIRDGVKELAPCVPVTDISRGVITFESDERV